MKHLEHKFPLLTGLMLGISPGSIVLLVQAFDSYIMHTLLTKDKILSHFSLLYFKGVDCKFEVRGREAFKASGNWEYGKE